ncbi:unnamed protein product [Arctogadus glacialis]
MGRCDNGNCDNVLCPDWLAPGAPWSPGLQTLRAGVFSEFRLLIFLQSAAQDVLTPCFQCARGELILHICIPMPLCREFGPIRHETERLGAQLSPERIRMHPAPPAAGWASRGPL